MRDVTSETISNAFAAYAAGASNARARDVLCALARHLHAFVRETRLTHAEWRAGLAALRRAGAITNDARDEFTLFSDLLGVSLLVDLLHTSPHATSSSNLGPFHRRGAPALANGGDLRRGQPGEPLAVVGSVIDREGNGVADAVLDVWQTAGNGLYAAQDAAQPEMNFHGRLTCAADGGFCFTTVTPMPYTVPYDGPAGDMLRLLGRQAWRPSHLHFICEAPGFIPLVTEIFPADDPWLDRDAVFGVRPDLIVAFRRGTDRETLPPTLQQNQGMPDGFCRVDVTLRLAAASPAVTQRATTG